MTGARAGRAMLVLNRDMAEHGEKTKSETTKKISFHFLVRFVRSYEAFGPGCLVILYLALPMYSGFFSPTLPWLLTALLAQDLSLCNDYCQVKSM